MEDTEKRTDLPEEAEDNIIYLEGEDGQDVPFELLDIVVYQDYDYCILLPMDEDADKVAIMLIVEGEEDELEYVEDTAVLDAVFNLFKETHKDEYLFD